ncbi:MAG: NlpC/P60 family protein [Flavobacteriales bacterium]
MIPQIAYCKVAIAPVRHENSDRAEMVTQLLFGELVDILDITEKWWKIQTLTDNYVGWIDPKQVRKLSKKEASRWSDGLTYLTENTIPIVTPWGSQIIVKGSFVPFGVEDDFLIGNDEFKVLSPISKPRLQSPVELATEYLNAPYLWGGKSPFGIDCSGLTQQVFRFLDINLPRDAAQQLEFGIEIDFNEIQSGDLAFFANENGSIIHVGILIDNQTIIHASGQVRTDAFDKTGIIHYSNEFHTHFLHTIKRMI